MEPWQLRRVREYVEARIGGRISISDLSGIARLSEAHFSRGFKNTFGQTPHAYVMRRRVERARHLMCVSDNSLSEIALACGFSDQAHFCRLFRRCIGQSPAAWRRRYWQQCGPVVSRDAHAYQALNLQQTASRYKPMQSAQRNLASHMTG